MKIAVVSPYAWMASGGVSNHVSSLVRHLEQRGHQAIIIAPAVGYKKNSPEFPENYVFAGRAFSFNSNGSTAQVSVWPFMIQKMGRLYAKYKPDLVHVHEPTIPAVGAAATMAAEIPVVATFHAAGDASSYYQRWRPLADRILSSITVRVAVSEAAKECVTQHFPDGEYHIIPNGIDIGTYAPARDGQRIPGRILFIGRTDPRKGLPVLLEAFARLRDNMPQASLVLAGPSVEEVNGLLGGSNHNKSEMPAGVTVLGKVSDEEKVAQMGQAELLCAPSLGGESFGIILTEALAGGLPVIASDIPGYRAVLGGGESGVLVPPGDSSALCESLRTVLADSHLRAELSARGIVSCEKFSWDRVADQLIEVYQEALQLGPRYVADPRVPIVPQLKHLLRLRAAKNAKSQPGHQ